MSFYFRGVPKHIAPIRTTKVKISPSCKNCTYFEKGGCKLYSYDFATSQSNSPIFYYYDADLCRNDKDLCGPDGKYFKTKSNDLLKLD